MAHIGVRISKQDKEKLNEIAKETDTLTFTLKTVGSGTEHE